MTAYPQIALTLLAIASVTLVWLAITDFREFRIRNRPVLVLAGLYFAHALASGSWISMYWNIGFAVLIGGAALIAYSFQQMGGGDVKLLTVACLWAGPIRAAMFAILLAVFVILHYGVARLGWVASKPSASGVRIPLAPSVAAALIGTFALEIVSPMR